MEEEKKEPVPTAEQQMALSQKAQEIQRNEPQSIPVCGKLFKLRRISNKIAAKITNLAYDALYMERAMKDEKVSRRQAKRINLEMRKVPAKMAAYYNLGRWAHLPFLWRIRWRQIWRMSEEVSASINATCTTGNDKDFFLANSEVIKYLLALSMRGVGESVKQMLERKESAESMLDEDALPKKEEGNKSGARSSARKTTKR